MKKIFRIILLLFILFLVFQFLVTLFISKHDVTYSIIEKDGTYSVHEIFQDDVYNIEISDSKKKKYHFQIPYNYNKQEQIFTSLKVATEGETTCIYPNLKDNKESFVSCYYNDQEVSLQVIKDENEELFLKLKDKLAYEEDVVGLEQVENDLTYYKDNMKTEDVFVVWAYNGVYYISSDKVKRMNFFGNDQYENNYSFQAGKYYLMLNTDDNYEFTKLYLLNLETGSRDTWTLPNPISKDSYFLGTVLEEAYLFDRKNLVEYKLIPKDKKIEVVGNKDKNGIYYTGEFKERNIYDFSKEELKFSTPIVNSWVEENYSDALIYEGLRATYFTLDKNLYVSYQGFEESPVLLLKGKELEQVKLLDNQIYFIDGDTIYSYDNFSMLKPLLSRREILFNRHNIYAVYKKGN